MINFYTTVLGCNIEGNAPQQSGLTQLRAGHALIDLIDINSEIGRAGGGASTGSENNLDHFCLQIKPLSEPEIIRHLTAFDVEMDGFSERYGSQGHGVSIYIKDPDGNKLELRNHISK